MAWMLWLVGTGCTGPKDDGTTPIDSDTETDDTSVDSEETGTDSDTETTDTETGTDVGTTVVLVVTPAPTETMAYAVVQFQGGESGLVLSDAIATGALDAESVTFSIPEPDEADLVELDPVNLPGVMGAAFLIGAHEDDGSEAHDEDEAWRGVSRAQLIWFPETPPEAFEGMVAGWNVLVLGEPGEPPTVGDLGAVPLALDLLPHTELTFGGTYDTARGEPARLVFAPPDVFGGTSTAAVYVDTELSATWTLTLVTAPPADHQTEPAEGMRVATESIGAFVDADGNSAWSLTDTSVGPLCHEYGVVLAGWYADPLDLGVAFGYSVQRIPVGWGAFVVAESSTITLPPEELLDLIAAGDCS